MKGAADSNFAPRPTITILKRRATLLNEARRFFLDRGYWEVDTPILSADTCVDAHIDPIEVPIDGRTYYLQTSPEFAMKRLLAAGSGSIFQIGHVLRAHERGRWHNTEFTMIEWYNAGATLDELMDEVSALVGRLGNLPSAERISYRNAFQQATGFDPLTAEITELHRHAKSLGLSQATKDRAELLNFLWADRVEPTLGATMPIMVFDYPPMMAALARTRLDDRGDLVAERFELFWKGIELCNGYHELLDADELKRRFEEQNAIRKSMGQNILPTESRLLDAMRAGLPACSGVALGFDRLTMLILDQTCVADVLPFPDDRA